MKNLLMQTLILSSVSVFGTTANILAFIVSYHKRDNFNNYFITALSLSDIICTSIILPLTIYFELVLFETSSIHLCKFYHFLNTSIIPASCLLLTTIAVERCFLMCYNRCYYLTKIRSKLLIIFILSISL
jgi:hypothetical protein